MTLPHVTQKVNETADQVTAAITHGGNTPSPAQTADSKDVRSLVKKAPDRIVDNDAEYYWIGDLTAQVSQSAPGFTPSPYQLFIKVITEVFNLIMMDIGVEEWHKAHRTLHSIARIFTSQEGKYAHSWARFCDQGLLEMSNLVLTWSVYTLAHHEIHMGNLLKTFINAIASIIITLMQFSDPKGEAYAMSPTAPPRVSHTHIIGLPPVV
jgi:hypothetical protein